MNELDGRYSSTSTMSHRELLSYYGYSHPGWLGGGLAGAISAGLRTLGSGYPLGADDLAVLLGRGHQISRRHPELEAAVVVLVAELEREASLRAAEAKQVREAHTRALVIDDLREMWNAMWTATRDAEDLALRDQRFEVWLAEPPQQQLVADKLAVGWLWRGGRWMTFDELTYPKPSNPEGSVGQGGGLPQLQALDAKQASRGEEGQAVTASRGEWDPWAQPTIGNVSARLANPSRDRK